MVWLALGFATVAFVWRHVVGQTPAPSNPGVNLMFDKWHQGPLRLINVLVLLLRAHAKPRPLQSGRSVRFQSPVCLALCHRRKD
jgi:hypothetical protein